MAEPNDAVMVLAALMGFPEGWRWAWSCAIWLGAAQANVHGSAQGDGPLFLVLTLHTTYGGGRSKYVFNVLCVKENRVDFVSP